MPKDSLTRIIDDYQFRNNFCKCKGAFQSREDDFGIMYHIYFCDTVSNSKFLIGITENHNSVQSTLRLIAIDNKKNGHWNYNVKDDKIKDYFEKNIIGPILFSINDSCETNDIHN